MIGERQDGTRFTLEKDCNCASHDGPHWIYMDRLWRDKNKALLDPAGKTLSQCYFGTLGFATEEAARLDAKAAAFRSYGIVRIIEEAEVVSADPAPAPALTEEVCNA